MLYSDEDKLSPTGERCVPSLKPDWSPELLLSSAYFCHMLVVRRSLVTELGGLRPAFDGSQDYDLMLRATEVAREVVHVPEILYHWRVLAGSTSADQQAKPWAFEAERRALEEALERRSVVAAVEAHPRFAGNFNLRRAVLGEPLVSVIIPFRDEPAVTASCYRSLVAAPGYENYELVFVDNASELPETELLVDELALDPKVSIVHDPQPFDWVAINNAAAHKARGDVLLFLNNDIEARSPGWLAAMLGHAQRDEVGAVGALLRYPDLTVQHAGIVLAMSWGAAHVQQGLPEGRTSYMLITELTRDCTAVTGACLMTRRCVLRRPGWLRRRPPRRLQRRRLLPAASRKGPARRLHAARGADPFRVQEPWARRRRRRDTGVQGPLARGALGRRPVLQRQPDPLRPLLPPFDRRGDWAMEHLPLDARSVLEELRSADASLAEALPRTWVPSASFDALVEEAERMPLAVEEHLLWLHDNCDLAAALAPLEGSGLRGWAKRWAHRIVLAVMNPYLVKVQDCIVETVRALDERARPCRRAGANPAALDSRGPRGPGRLRPARRRAPRRVTRVALVTARWSDSQAEPDTVVRLMAGALARNAEVEVVSLLASPQPEDRDAWPRTRRDGVFRVHEVQAARRAGAGGSHAGCSRDRRWQAPRDRGPAPPRARRGATRRVPSN